MLTNIYITLSLINLIFVFLRKKSRLILPINCTFIILLVLGTTTTGDYANYELKYDFSYLRNSFEFGYNLIMDLGNTLGLEFQIFWVSLIILFGSIVLWYFQQYSNNYPLFFSLYYVYMLFIDIDQLRSFCATALMTVAFIFLIKGKFKLYLLITLIATSFHLSMLFFLPLAFVDLSKNVSKKLIKICCCIIISACIVLFFLGNRIGFLINLSTLLLSLLNASEKLYYLNSQMNYGFLLYFSLHMMAIFTTCYCKFKIQSIKDENCNAATVFIEKCLMLQLYCIFSFPLIMIHTDFYRIFRSLCFIDFICWAVALDNIKRKGDYYKCLILICVSTFLYRFPLVHGLDQIDIILENHEFLN